jgi:ABC-2 type transport system ATP-binding protein
MTNSPNHVPAIEVRGLSKTYAGGVEAVRGIDFTVAPGEVFGLLGPNGAGKSTTVGMLTTTIAPTSGTARLAGYDVGSRPVEARRVSSVVFQETVLDRGLSGRRNLMLHARLWRVEPRSAARHLAELVETFDLGDVIDRPVERYSGGQRRRLEIARALLSTPKVLFLDEPTVGLDTRIRYELLDIVAGLRRRTEMTTLLTTHYLDEAQRLCDRIAIVSAGRIVALDTPRGLVEALGSDILEIRVDGDPVAALALLRSREVTDGDGIVVGSTLTMPVRHRSLSATRALVEQLLPTSTLTVRPPGLDDVYLRLTGNEIAAA